MSSPSHSNSKPIAGKHELVNWFAQACTPAAKRLIGVEHEKPPFYLDNLQPVPFVANEDGRHGISDFIARMTQQHGWQQGEVENGQVIDIYKKRVNWTFEPGLQMETGGAPLRSVHQIARETDRMINEAVKVASELGFGMLAMGYHPTHGNRDIPSMPKSRYATIREYVRTHKYPNALDAMYCTSSAQANLGYQSEADMVKMLRVSLSLQPIVTALCANSPFAYGGLTGYQSFRSHKIYNNMGGRYGFMLPVAFEEGFGFEMFVDYALERMPMMGVYKGSVFLDAKGANFKSFMEGRLEACPGQVATLDDWQNHLNTIWSEVRLRRFLEMRGADNGPAEMIKAQAALWTGLLYDSAALDAAYEMVRDWTPQDRDYLRLMVPVHGLQTKFLGTTVQEFAKNALALAETGLKTRRQVDNRGNDESGYLAPMHEIAASGLNWAQRLEHRFRHEWHGDINKVFETMDYARSPSVLAIEASPRRKAGKPFNLSSNK